MRLFLLAILCMFIVPSWALGAPIFTLDAAAEGSWTGSADGELVGANSKVIGNISGSGPAVAVIGSYSDGGSQSGSGAIKVLFPGHPEPTLDQFLNTVAPASSLTIWGPEAGVPIGSSLNQVTSADMNGDGFEDVIVGAPFSNSANGALYIVWGGSMGKVVDLADPLPSADFIRLTGEISNPFFGGLVVHGDYNNDGIDDLVISAASKGYIVWGSVVPLADSNITALAATGIDGDMLGYWTMDANGDGVDDLALSSLDVSSSTVLDIVQGHSGLWVDIDYATNINAVSYRISSSDPLDIGNYVENVDLDNDTFSDLIIASPGWGVGNEGKITIVWGPLPTNDFALQSATTNTLVGANAGDTFGHSIVTAEIDAESGRELVIGSLGENMGAGAVYVLFSHRQWRQNGLGSPGQAYVRYAGTYGAGESLLAWDFDADGSLDIGWNESMYNTSVLTAAGALRWAHMPDEPVAWAPTQLTGNTQIGSSLTCAGGGWVWAQGQLAQVEWYKNNIIIAGQGGLALNTTGFAVADQIRCEMVLLSQREVSNMISMTRTTQGAGAGTETGTGVTDDEEETNTIGPIIHQIKSLPLKLERGKQAGGSHIHLKQCTIRGTNQADVLKGTPGKDVICGLGGNDIIRGFAGNDLIDGGSGNDIIYGGAGHDQIIGLAGADKIFGGSGNDRIGSGHGRDTVYGGNGHDLVYAGSGDDKVFAGKGNDKVFALAGNDIVWLGSGNNRAVGGLGADRLYGGSDKDILAGSQGRDALFGGKGKDVLHGNSGADRLYGQSGKDILRGGAQGDSLSGGSSADIIFGDSGNDRLMGRSGADRLVGGTGRDKLYGNGSNDYLYGSKGRDALFGGKGNDYLRGGPGEDTLHGADGSDCFVINVDVDVPVDKTAKDSCLGYYFSWTLFRE